MVGRSSTGESRYRLTERQRSLAEHRFAALIGLLGYRPEGAAGACASAG